MADENRTRQQSDDASAEGAQRSPEEDELPPESPTRAEVRASAQRARVEAQAGRARKASLLAEGALLRAASRATVARSQELRASLRASVTDYARRLHEEQVPPQRMLVMVKNTVREALPSSLDIVERRELMDAVVRWSIAAYYAA